MEFRPCIDIHNGQVKQIVGGSLQDAGDQAIENFTAEKDAAYYAELYRECGLKGGHVILLNAGNSFYYEATKHQAKKALAAYPDGLQAGGGITDENALEFLEAGASHVIVTSYIFQDGQIRYDHIEKMKRTVGREHLVLDVSCRKRNDEYYVVTDRWQKFTDVKMTMELLQELSASCDEFLVHAVDVEGRSAGIDREIVEILAAYAGAENKNKLAAVTYAGGISTYNDIELLRELGAGRVNATIGSALDLFGGNLEFKKILKILNG